MPQLPGALSHCPNTVLASSSVQITSKCPQSYIALPDTLNSFCKPVFLIKRVFKIFNSCVLSSLAPISLNEAVSLVEKEGPAQDCGSQVGSSKGNTLSLHRLSPSLPPIRGVNVIFPLRFYFLSSFSEHILFSMTALNSLAKLREGFKDHSQFFPGGQRIPFLLFSGMLSFR